MLLWLLQYCAPCLGLSTMMVDTDLQHCSTNLMGTTDLKPDCSGERRHPTCRQNQLGAGTRGLC